MIDLEPPQEFDRRNLDVPTIEFQTEETQQQKDRDPVAVSLVCKARLLNGVGLLDNVTYKIEWFSEGQLLQDPTIRCAVANGNRRNPGPCPNSDSLVSVLVPGDKYKAGMSVGLLE